jgi:flagellar hook-associated protein 2
VDPSGTTDEEILREIADAVNVAMDDATDADTIDEDEGAFGSVVNETTDTARLSLRSGSTGYAGRLQFSDSADGLLSMLGVTEGAVATGTAGGMITDVGTSESDSDLNARFVLDGLTIYRSSNQVTDALDGITLNLLQTTETNADFTITPDTDSIKGQLNDFIKKYNDVLEFIKIQSNVDSDLEIRGPFAGDSTFRSLRFEMRNLVSQRVDGQPAAGPDYLSDLGININDDGTLVLEDEEALTAALEEDTNAVQSLFGSENGVAKQLETMLDSYLGSKGIIDNRIDSVDQQIRRLGNRIETFQSRLNQREEQLRVQFANLQETMANFQSQQSFLGAFLGGGF